MGTLITEQVCISEKQKLINFLFIMRTNLFKILYIIIRTNLLTDITNLGRKAGWSP